ECRSSTAADIPASGRPPLLAAVERCHCERSEAISKRPNLIGSRLLRRLRLLAMTSLASISHGRIVADMRSGSTLTVAVIGTTQTLAWASSYYLPAILAEPIAAGLGVSRALFFGFFSASLLLQAAIGPMIGRAIDRHRGRGVLVLSNLVLAAGLG